MAPNHEKDDDFPPRLPQAGGKEIHFDKEELNSIADRLQKDLDRLKDKPHKEAVENVPSGPAVGTHSAGDGVHRTVRAASTEVGRTYAKFIEAYEDVIKALRKSKQNLQDADDDAKRRANRVH
jgi:ribosome-associated translation inhibitor RaiA